MHLLPHELDKLHLCSAGQLAQRRYARGLQLNRVETIALISLVLLELARDGKQGVAELSALGKQILGHNDVRAGARYLVNEVQVEACFADGTK